MTYTLRAFGQDYDLLTEAAKSIVGVPGLTVEVGLHRGGGSKYIIDALVETNQKRTHIAIDPYGQIPYPSDKKEDHNYDYHNEHKRQTMIAIHEYLQDKPDINFCLFVLEDTEFFKRFRDGVPVYFNHTKEIVNQYALVYFDGPHTTSATLLEAEFFAERAPVGACFVFDDTNLSKDGTPAWYDHTKIREYLESHGWVVLREGVTKMSYRKEH